MEIDVELQEAQKAGEARATELEKVTGKKYHVKAVRDDNGSIWTYFALHLPLFDMPEGKYSEHFTWLDLSDSERIMNGGIPKHLEGIEGVSMEGGPVGVLIHKGNEPGLLNQIPEGVYPKIPLPKKLSGSLWEEVETNVEYVRKPDLSLKASISIDILLHLNQPGRLVLAYIIDNLDGASGFSMANKLATAVYLTHHTGKEVSTVTVDRGIKNLIENDVIRPLEKNQYLLNEAKVCSKK